MSYSSVLVKKNCLEDGSKLISPVRKQILFSNLTTIQKLYWSWTWAFYINKVCKTTQCWLQIFQTLEYKPFYATKNTLGILEKEPRSNGLIALEQGYSKMFHFVRAQARWFGFEQETPILWYISWFIDCKHLKLVSKTSKGSRTINISCISHISWLLKYKLSFGERLSDKPW